MEEGKGVCVHGIPINVSPAKEGRKAKGVYYLEAKLSDGKRSARVVSFDIAQLEAVKKAEAEQSVMALGTRLYGWRMCVMPCVHVPTARLHEITVILTTVGPTQACPNNKRNNIIISYSIA